MQTFGKNRCYFHASLVIKCRLFFSTTPYIVEVSHHRVEGSVGEQLSNWTRSMGKQCSLTFSGKRRQMGKQCSPTFMSANKYGLSLSAPLILCCRQRLRCCFISYHISFQLISPYALSYLTG